MKTVDKTIHIIKILSFLFCGLYLAGCNKDFLDRENPSSISSDEVWIDQSLIELYVNQLYNDRLDGWKEHVYNNITDESRLTYPGLTPNQILIGQWDEVNNPMDVWTPAYTSIRRMNEFFTHIKTAPLADSVKEQLSGDVYFLRAFMYFDLVKRYGGVPLLTQPQDINDDLAVSRAGTEETFQFILDDLDRAYERVPETALKAKASKSAVLALKGRVLLYWASPLFNLQNDQGRWQQAAVVNRQLIEEGKYDLYDDLSTLWLNSSNNESIFQIEYHLPEKYHDWDALVKPLVLANNVAGYGSILQDLVDAFPMSNGKAIHEQGSGYNDQNPYVNRDKRFYAYVAYNGSKMKGTTSGPPLKEVTLQIYRGGRDYDADPSSIIYNTTTGYYTIKGVNPENTIYRGGYGSDQPWIELRYAEVLLNYAEAQNEFLGAPDQSVYDALNLIRRRAGISNDLIPGSYSKDQMRSFIHNERYVELCLEHKRYWDLRRWKSAGTILNGKRGTGVVITKEANGSFSYDYEPVDPQPNVFTDKMYFMPIPREEITKNVNLIQNPGWE